MRIPLLLALALLLAMPAQAQPPAFTETYQVRAAYGDIPTSDFAEPAGRWNVEQRLEVPASTAERTLQFDLPASSTMENVSCTCGAVTHAPAGGGLAVTVPANWAGTLSVATSSLADRDAFTLRLAPPSADPSQVLVVYVPLDAELTGPDGFAEVGQSTGGTAVIHYASGSAADPLSSPLWFSVHPPGAAGTAAAPAASPAVNWLLLGAAFIVGMIVWALLVSKGAVQRRSRKQEVATASHVEAAKVGKPVLEARKRALMAGLKELEMAKMNKEVEDAAYDTVKAEFKAEAVTTMRAIEEAGQKSG